jgi:hypothetical protein
VALEELMYAGNITREPGRSCREIQFESDCFQNGRGGACRTGRARTRSTRASQQVTRRAQLDGAG